MTTIKNTKAGSRSPGEKRGSQMQTESGRPTDMELMLYFDGELDDKKSAAIKAYLAKDTSAQSKLSGLRIVSALVREKAASQSVGFDIADSVMARIEADLDAPVVKESQASKPADMLASRPGTLGRSTPANDNSRSIFTLAAIAVAAAAAMMIWGRMSAEPARSAENSRPATIEAAPQEPTAPASTSAAHAEVPAPEGDMEPGVEVAAVDFGAHMGTIFYVPTGAAVSSATTTVVWVDDEVAGGDK